MIYYEGLKIEYDGYKGIVKYIGNHYITMCLKTFPNEKVRDVCMLIYKKDFNKIKLFKESQK
jgi:hypothetical protein